VFYHFLSNNLRSKRFTRTLSIPLDSANHPFSAILVPSFCHGEILNVYFNHL